MANEKAVLYVASGRPIPGREPEAMKLWMELGPTMDSFQSKGFFARWDGFWLTPHGGSVNSTLLMYGDRAKLDELRRTDEFEALVFKMSSCMDNLAVIPGVHYNAARETMARRQSAVGKDK